MRVAIIGATGFTGSAITRAIDAHPALTAIPVSRTPDQWGSRSRIADILDRPSLEAALKDADVVVHAAAQINGHPGQLRATNIQGTANVARVSEARGARLIALSTTAVYGTGPHRGANATTLTPAPESETSRTRLIAEEHVRSAGGSVIRASLLYGNRDRWFLPLLFQATEALRSIPTQGQARISTLHVDDLGKLIAGLTARISSVPEGATYDAAHPTPSTIREVVIDLYRLLERTVPAERQDDRTVEALASAHKISRHQLGLITQDHWYNSDALIRDADVEITPRFTLRDTDQSWYRTLAAKLPTDTPP